MHFLKYKIFETYPSFELLATPHILYIMSCCPQKDHFHGPFLVVMALKFAVSPHRKHPEVRMLPETTELLQNFYTPYVQELQAQSWGKKLEKMETGHQTELYSYASFLLCLIETYSFFITLINKSILDDNARRIKNSGSDISVAP